MEPEQLLKYCHTPQETEKLNAWIKHGTKKLAAHAIGISERNFLASITRIKARASLKGFAPEHGLTIPAAPGMDIKRISTNYNFVDQASGERRQAWIIQEPNKQAQREGIIEGIEAALSQYKGSMGVARGPKLATADMMHLVPIGDPHIGMYAWQCEAGEDFNIEIAREDLLAGIRMTMAAAPACEECLVVNLGDFFHADNSENRTMRSGHALDVDTRYARVADLGMRLMIDVIHEARRKHGRVRVISLPGNHDDHSGIMLGVALKYIFHNDPRVIIDDSASLFRYHQFGQSLLGFTHGHTVKPAVLGEVMASDRKKEWGETTYRYWHTGHIHSNNSMDCRGWRWESHRTLAAQDAWASGAGYRSGRDIKGILYHREYGEVNRTTYDIRAIRGLK